MLAIQDPFFYWKMNSGILGRLSLPWLGGPRVTTMEGQRW